MDPSLQAGAFIGAGRSALIGAMFGAGWLGWGLGSAKAFNGFTAPTFGFIALFLLVGSIYLIHKGRLLRKKCPVAVESTRQTVRKWFLFIVLMEALAIALVSILAYRLHRADLATNWCAMIVGLHFLPLARIFRAPHLIVRGILITVWCVFCWAFFRSNALVISTSLGTGILLWGSCVFSWFRARKIAQSLCA
jgi:nicotinamide riboside transporter PnuC